MACSTSVYPPPSPQSVMVSQLWKRYQKRLIYTYVGDILVSINPFQQLDIYNDKVGGGGGGGGCLATADRTYVS